MRSILLHIHDDHCLEACRQVAFDLARAFTGHVTCLQPVPLEVGYGDFYGIAAAQIVPQIQKNAEEVREAQERHLAGEDAPWNWVVDHQWARLALREYAPLNDVIITGACGDSKVDASYKALATEMVIKLRTPVLLVPEQTRSFDATAPVVIAWNGSGEAANAMRGALPLLKTAASVTVLSVEEEASHPRLPPEAAAAYLSRHDIGAEIVVEPPLKDGIAATIAHVAERKGASCIVMGAYGHSRLREFALGGVSRSLLTSPPIPLFLAH